MSSLPTELLTNFTKRAEESLSREPANLDEALVRFMVICGNAWMVGQEPFSTELERLLDFYVASLRWDERAMVKPFLHVLRKTREGVLRDRASEEARGEAARAGVL